MRHRLTKLERKAVYDKCGGHCAYCGREIPFKGFHADHIRSFRLHEIDTIDNMLPACGSCNRYKSTYDLETFRRMLSGIPKRLARDISTYNIAVRFGIVEEHNEPIKFYFERESVRGHVDGESVNVYANGSWIPVEERLPEPNKKVLATILHHKWVADYDSDWVPEDEKTVHEAWIETSEVVYIPEDGFLYNDSECGFTSSYAYIKPEPNMSRPVDEVVAWLPMPEPYQAEGRKK